MHGEESLSLERLSELEIGGEKRYVDELILNIQSMCLMSQGRETPVCMVCVEASFNGPLGR